MRLLTSDQRDLAAACRDVLSSHVTSERLRSLAASRTGVDDELEALIAELGWASLAVPSDAGGLEGSVPDLCLIAEEVGRSLHPTILPQSMAAARIIADFGSEALRNSILPGVSEGQHTLAWSVGEPSGGDGMSLTASGSGYLLNGRLRFVPIVHAASHLLAAAVLDDSMCLVVIPVNATGVSLSAQSTMDITRRHWTVECGAVRIAQDSVLTGGASAANALFNLGVVLQCSESIGVATRLLEMTITYSHQRSQFGKPIGSFQALKHRMADMLIEKEAARVAAWQSAEDLQEETSNNNDVSVSVAKSLVAPMTNFIAGQALQVHGGIGFTWEHDLHLYLRRAKVNSMMLGSPRWHNERIVRGVTAQSGVAGLSVAPRDRSTAPEEESLYS